MISAWELAELLKPELDAVGAASGAAIAFRVEGPTVAPDMDRSVDGSTLQLQPWEETEETFDRGDAQRAERAINVICQRPLDNGGEKKCFQWLNEVKASFAELELDGWRWVGNETVTLYDSDAAQGKMQFLSLFRARFRNFG